MGNKQPKGVPLKKRDRGETASRRLENMGKLTKKKISPFWITQTAAPAFKKRKKKCIAYREEWTKKPKAIPVA